MPLHRWMIPRVTACLVTGEQWCEYVTRLGGKAIVLHESPISWNVVRPQRDYHPANERALFVCTFSRDEPVAEAILGAATVPQVEFRVTGDPRRIPLEISAIDVPNVRFVGFLPFDRYREEVWAADMIVALTTEPTSAMRAAFEAVWAEKRLVLSDSPLLRSLFPHATFVDNSALGIADGLRSVPPLTSDVKTVLQEARDAQMARWDCQLGALRAALAIEETSSEYSTKHRARNGVEMSTTMGASATDEDVPHRCWWKGRPS